mgnify:CR=1 FL=1
MTAASANKVTVPGDNRLDELKLGNKTPFWHKIPIIKELRVAVGWQKGMLITGLAITAFFLLVALFAPLIAPYGHAQIKAADGITKDTVKLEDKDVLEKAEKALEDALRDFSGNYTEEEQGNLEAKLETVKAALAAIGNAEKAADEIAKLPNVDDVKLSDKDEVDRVKEIISGMTENEKSMLGKDTLDRVNALAEKIQKLAEEAGKSDTPKTGDTSNPALWSARAVCPEFRPASGGAQHC